MENQSIKLEKWFKKLRFFERFLYRPFKPYKQHGLRFKHNYPCVLVCNHYSIWDIVYPVMATDQPVHYMAKSSIWNKKIGKWFAEKSGCIPVNRDGNDMKAVMQAMKYLKNGEIVGIFPEGTRNKTEEVFLPFKSGATALAIKMRVPIVPIVLVSKAKLFKKVHILYGEPIEFKNYYQKKLTQEDLQKCDEFLRDTMLKMREDFLQSQENK